MKLLLKSLLIFLLSVPMLAQDSLNNLKTYSIGARALHLYDLPSYKFDNDLSEDLKGLNGEYTSVDVGGEVYAEKQFTPLLGAQAGFRMASLSGANDVEHYKSKFHEGYADLIFILSNLDRNRVDARFNFYGKIGFGGGKFRAERFLNADQSSNGIIESNYWEGRAGAGVQYELTKALRLEVDATYNLAYDDGFDGYDNASGSDPYLSTGIGIAYTFGQKDKKPMYAVNFFGKDYAGEMTNKSLPEFNADDRTKLNAYMKQMEEYKAKVDSLLTWQTTFFEDMAQVVDQQSSIIDEQSKALADQTEVINELQVAMEQQDLRLEQLESLAAMWESPDYRETTEMINSATASNSQTNGANGSTQAATPAQSGTSGGNTKSDMASSEAGNDLNEEMLSFPNAERDEENLLREGEITASIDPAVAGSTDSETNGSEENGGNESINLKAGSENSGSEDKTQGIKGTMNNEFTTYFDFDSDKLDEKYKQQLREKMANKEGEVILIGYADIIGADAYNQRLKARRAEAVKEFLTRELMYDPEKINIKIAPKQSDLGDKNYLNRKVEVKF